MEQYISHQLLLFLFSILTGAIISVIYDIFRVIRIAFRHTAIMIVSEDISFSFIALFICITFFSSFNYGQIRGFLVFGIIAGAIICNLTLGKIIIFASKIIINDLKRILVVIFYPIYIFFKGICKFFKKIYKIFKKVFIFLIKRVIIIKDNFTKRKEGVKTGGKN